MKYINYKSINNTVGLETDIDCYWELDDDGFVLRSIDHTYNGAVLKYSTQHKADGFGQLPEGKITRKNLDDQDYGVCKELSRSTFEQVWNSTNWNQ